MAETTADSTSKLVFSDKVMETLDPCVVLMKSLISQYAHLWEDRGGVYSLAQGVVYWEPPPSTTQAISDAIKEPQTYALHTYCPDEGLPEFREALKEKIAQQNGLTNHDVMVTAGANQAYTNCVLTLLSQGDKCVVFKPYYFNHVMAIQMTQGNDAVVVGSCDDHGIPDLDWLESALQNDQSIRVVTLTNPGNPTGVSLKRAVLQQAVDLCAKYGVWLVLDTTYEHFDHINANSVPGVPFAGFPDEHVIHIFSFSKGYALAGFRCGYVVLSKEGKLGTEAYKQMLKVQDTIPICPPRISQVAAMGALSAGRDWVHNKVNTLDTGRAAIFEALSPLAPIMGGTGAMYVMAKLPDGMDDQEVARQLVEDFGVALIPGSFCGFPGWIRVCYSNLPPKECQIAANRLAEGIRKICNEL
eukprot:CAMPEP_0195302746 /NCGR_PEP_ID=MMETSP0707-20130614/31592_1 /TAXON_ID=33640 /ORGANISM="Asterionellopsis glacialis, Strain CCMP134" /LENGTH=413 /DNA_ID=CAMNT_0040366079 /DNA_START=284 /DNA_END=1525 /DNA_ORIENTATION=+